MFSSNHELSSPYSILQYWSYFVIICAVLSPCALLPTVLIEYAPGWVWASQILYDTRFEANDWLHRLFKLLQLAAFSFVGVTSQNFDPSNILPPVSTSNGAFQMAGPKQGGWNSFRGVCVAYAVSRAVLGVQYLYGRRAFRGG